MKKSNAYETAKHCLEKRIVVCHRDVRGLLDEIDDLCERLRWRTDIENIQETKPIEVILKNDEKKSARIARPDKRGWIIEGAQYYQLKEFLVWREIPKLPEEDHE